MNLWFWVQKTRRPGFFYVQTGKRKRSITQYKSFIPLLIHSIQPHQHRCSLSSSKYLVELSFLMKAVCCIGNVHELVRDFQRWYLGSGIPKLVTKAGDDRVVTSQSASVFDSILCPIWHFMSITLDVEGLEDLRDVAPVTHKA